jgi:uncharacterized protein (TIGR03435 family)
MHILFVLATLLMVQDDKRPEFEVASIKPASPDARGMWVRNAPGGRVNITNMSLKEMIVMSYRIQPYQISGGPAWLDKDRYDITAKAEKEPKQGEWNLLLQSLLADRFQLTLRKETKELPIYALVLARKDGKLGPKLTESKDDGCVKFDPAHPADPPAPGEPRPRYCGNQMMSPRSLTAVSIPVGNIVPMLARLLGRTIIDDTGLKGNFDISMEWAPDDAQLAMLPPDTPRPAADGSGPSIFTALQEQLGLKLESRKGPVEIYVVEKAEKPTEN